MNYLSVKKYLKGLVMKKLHVLTTGLLLWTSASMVFAGGALHSEHKGKRHANHPGNSAMACKEMKIGQFKPAELSEVAPGSDFSFVLFDAQIPRFMEVTIKQVAVPVTFEKKGDWQVAHGKLPADLSNTAARITVKIKGKLPKCNMEDGWLIKITP